jgi:FkbH-like protein
MKTLSEILSYNRNAKTLSYNTEANISILSNIVVNQLVHPLSTLFYEMGIKPKIEFGEYDNIVQDAARFSSSDVVIIFWELNNLIDGLQFLGTHYKESDIDKIVTKTEDELLFIFKTMSRTPLVLINEFTTDPFNNNLINENAIDKLCGRLNLFLLANIPANFKIVKIQRIISRISIEKSFDLRNFYTSKALYSFDFLKVYTQDIKAFLASRFGKAKKVLVLDCDNTIWGGIIGEDGINGIKCDSSTSIGKIFYEVQKMVNTLIENGVIVCLNSKNNLFDVEEVFAANKMPLDFNRVVVKKVNWENKIKNLVEISRELNVGVDSLLFIDDSDFEINLVKQELSDVQTIQVPKDIYQYPLVFRKAINHFYNLNFTNEDLNKTEMYLVEQNRKIEQTQFDNLDSYLESLELKMIIAVNDISIIDRVAQMTQKTNQFNSTTQRLTSGEVKKIMETKNKYVFTFSLSDKFGDFGITGVAFVSIINNIGIVDDILMSCRVLGRKAEETFINEIFKFMKNNGLKECQMPFVLTNKNKQVEDFFKRSNFVLIHSNEEKALYKSDLNIDHKLAIIKVKHEK